MSRELTKMNLIAIVQQLPEEDIEVVETYIKMIERENKELKERINKTNNLINTILNLDYDKFCNYDTYINSIIEIKEELSGEKDV